MTDRARETDVRRGLVPVLDGLTEVSRLLDSVVTMPFDHPMVRRKHVEARSTLATLRERLSRYAETGASAPFGPSPPAPWKTF